jgi:phage terminase large subunit-like protein
MAQLAEALRYRWDINARSKQRLPAGEWFIWLILAGRGFGKTRTGAETVRQWVRTSQYVNLIGATADDARDIMIEGESGILAICPKIERPIYKKSDRQLVWPNGAKSLIFTADEPERLRGKQHEKLWADELGAWRYGESWAQAMFGLRLGKNPQGVVTTTPKPTKLVKELLQDKRNYITKGTTYENRSNLAQKFYDTVIVAYEGTRLGRQELNAEILEDIEGALWAWAVIENYRAAKAPELKRVIVAIDPAVSTSKTSDETGIITAGLGADGHGYVLGDSSGIYSPLGWAAKAIAQYELAQAECIVAEVNQGGDLVEANLRAAGFKGRVKKVHAARGKATRAEPIAGLYEQGKIHHAGIFAGLETQMTTWDTTTEDSPDRVDALVWAMTDLMLGGTTSTVADPFANW